jgi:hypothetical protein
LNNTVKKRTNTTKSTTAAPDMQREVSTSWQTNDAEDKRKLHAEVNQIVNQRILITTFSVTVFGVMIAWMIPKSAPQPNSDVEVFVYIGSTILSLTLMVLFLLSVYLTNMLRIFTSYLNIVAKSAWEADWYEYRKRYRYFGYTRPQALMFFLLGGISAIFPWLLSMAYNLRLDTNNTYATGAVGVVHMLLVILLGFARLYPNETKIMKRWLSIKKG